MFMIGSFDPEGLHLKIIINERTKSCSVRFFQGKQFNIQKLRSLPGQADAEMKEDQG